MSTNLAQIKSRPRRSFFARLAVILIALIILLGALTVGSTAAKTLIKPGIEPSGTLLYATGFDQPTDPNWEQYTSAVTAKIADGKLQLIADSVKANIFAPLAFSYRDFDLRVVSRQTLGEDPFSQYGVMFRLRDNYNYYLFRLRSDGSYSVYKRTGDSRKWQDEALSEFTVPESVPPPFAVGLNWANDIRIVAKGNHIQIFINGKQLTFCPKGTDRKATWNGSGCASNGGKTTQELVDDSFTDGRIALVIYENNDKVSVDFDNLVIFAP